MTTYDSRIRPRRSRNLCGSRTATSWGCIFRQIHTGIAHHYSSHRLHFRLKQQKNTPHLERYVTDGRLGFPPQNQHFVQCYSI